MTIGTRWLAQSMSCYRCSCSAAFCLKIRFLALLLKDFNAFMELIISKDLILRNLVFFFVFKICFLYTKSLIKFLKVFVTLFSFLFRSLSRFSSAFCLYLFTHEH